ncbi:MAG: hypothetical protein A2583_13775 [Bdellovibrionales bacterium RIFOXYD1_FULL_53_11]|nr:MAG: hypothetical protein A2583_13775 [Bdellovibrionales bacterium RIFOXYD1_FULL_53_11]
MNDGIPGIKSYFGDNFLFRGPSDIFPDIGGYDQAQKIIEAQKKIAAIMDLEDQGRNRPEDR